MSSGQPDGRKPATEVGNQDQRPKSKISSTKNANIGVSADQAPALGGERDSGQLKFRCPIRAQDPDRYKEVLVHCRADQAFSEIRIVNEHIRRYHSLPYWCTVCKTNFPTASEKTIDHVKRAHDKDCQPKIRSEEEELASHTYMTEEQQNSWGDGRWKKVLIQAETGDSTTKKNWKKIYKSLFPQDTKSPSPYHDSEVNSRIEASITATSIFTTVQDGTATGQDEITPPGDVIDPVNGGKSPSRDKDDSHIISGKRKATSEPDTDRLFTTNPKSASQFTPTEETTSEGTATNAHELNRGAQSPGTVDDFNTVFGDPLSADLTFDQIEQRKAGLDQAVWDDDPELMVNSHTSETIPSQPQSSSAAQDILAHYPYEIDDADLQGMLDGGTRPDEFDDLYRVCAPFSDLAENLYA